MAGSTRRARCILPTLYVGGNNISNLKVFVAAVISNSSMGFGDAFVARYDAETGNFEDQLFFDSDLYDIALVSDNLYPATNSNPYSIGVLYSKYSNTMDSVIFRSSSNGGVSLDGRQVIGVTQNRFRKVALAYGICPSRSNGNYFAVWEEAENINSTMGHIYTSHTNQYFNSAFTSPINLDSLDVSAINKSRNPTIACQYNNNDNDSANLTEIVIFEKFKPSNQTCDLSGYYNLQATTSNLFHVFNFTEPLVTNLQPNINFNPFDSTFMLTYFDSINHKLPFLINDFNMAFPNSWSHLTNGYNDSTNLTIPKPKVELNIGKHQGVCVWTADRTVSNGVSLFDSPYNIYLGIPGYKKTGTDGQFTIYPNPCRSSVTVAFQLENTEETTFRIYNLDSRSSGILINRKYLPGKYIETFDVSSLMPGVYIYIMTWRLYSRSGKLIILK